MKKPSALARLNDAVAALDEPDEVALPAEEHARLVLVLDDVLRLYFPRTRLDGWKIRVGTRARVARLAGACDPVTRSLWVNPAVVAGDPDALRATLIHEVNHVGSGLGHGSTFKRRLARLAEHARKRGEDNVARRLREDVASLGIREINAPDAYAWVTASVQARGERADFSEMVFWICTERAHGPTELLTRYPRLHQVFLLECARGPVLQDAMERARRFCNWQDEQPPRDA